MGLETREWKMRKMDKRCREIMMGFVGEGVCRKKLKSVILTESTSFTQRPLPMVAYLKLRLFLSRDRRERFTSEGAQVTTGQASTKVILPLRRGCRPESPEIPQPS